MPVNNTRTQQLAVVNIGYVNVLLPMTKALKIVEALQGAVRVDNDFDRHNGNYVYQIRENLEVELKMVKPSQILGGTIAPAKRTRGAQQLQLCNTKPEVL